MSFNIDRHSDVRRVQTNITGTGGDDINLSRDPFQIDPVRNRTEPEVGMEFLVDDDPPTREEVSYNNDNGDNDYDTEPDAFTTNQDRDNFQTEIPKTYEEIQQEKSYYLSQLKRLEKKGSVTSRRFTMEHSLDEIRGEVIRIKKEQDMDSSIDYCRQALMFCVSTIEMAEGKYNLGAELGGWSQNVMGNIESYDSVFEELYEKYASSVSVMPEIKLISMIGGSAFMFSLQKKLLKGTSAPPPRQREMDGPSTDTDELLRRLAEVDIDDIASDSSSSSGESIKITEQVPPSKTINVAKKPRGRPKKT